MAEDVVIFNIKYVPYKLKKGSTQAQISKHQEERRFYSMVDDDKIVKFLEEKKMSKVDYILTAFEIMQREIK